MKTLNDASIDLAAARVHPSPRARFRFIPVLLVLAIVALRIVAPGSDPYPSLDWSAGQFTDEGFYIHNARNAALFGHPRTDEFNNMLLSPLLHFAQVAVFKLFGAGAIQARSISVLCSLLTLILFWAALRWAFDSRIALTGAVFLGLDHTYLLFNRMALMDTPAALGAVAAFYAFVRATEREERQRRRWLAACGLLLALTIVNRTLCAYLLPVPFIALWRSPMRKSDYAALALSILFVVAVYLAVWYVPNHAEIAAMNHFYRTVQIQPHSFKHLFDNVDHALFGDYRGFAPYLFRHTPALFILAVLGVGYWTTDDGRQTTDDGRQTTDDAALVVGRRSSVVYLAAWLLLGWLLLSVISYSPSRYYVTTYPALAALAAIALWRLPELWSALWEDSLKTRLFRGALVWFLCYHAVEAVVHHGGVLSPLPTRLALYGLPTVCALFAASFVWRRGEGTDGIPTPTPPYSHTPTLLYGALALWLLVNTLWLADWALHIGYTQRDASRWLARNLPANSVVFGDPAPGLCLDNDLLVVPVFPLLANYKYVIEKFEGRPRYITFVLDSPLRRKYWRKYYPGCDSTERLVKIVHVLRWDIGIYAADSSIHFVNASSKKDKL